MAGINQHYIPQSLLRGFRVRGGSSARSKTWLVRKAEQPSLEIIKERVAVEEYFYSPLSADGSKTLDDQITDYENRFSRLLQSLKDASNGAFVEAAVAAEVIVHLTIRNAHIRHTFSGGVTELMSRVGELFASEETVKPLLGVDSKVPTERVRNAVDEELAKDPILASLCLPAPLMHKVAQMILQERFNRTYLEALPAILASLGSAMAQAPASIRDGHNKLLGDASVAAKRIELLANLDWRVQVAPNGVLILPDCVALGLDDESGFKSLLMADTDKVTQVLMPLSSTKMLVGQRGNQAIDLSDFNRAAASCSHEFFIAGSETVGLATLAALIGTASDATLREAVDTAIKEFGSPQREVADEPVSDTDVARLGAEPGTTDGFNFVVTFRDCADEPTAQIIGASVVQVVQSLSKVMPLERLDGITYAQDLAAAAANLDRGFEAGPLQPTRSEHAVGVALAPTVLRNGVSKVHVLIHGDIGHCLIDQNDDNARHGLHTLVHQLAHVTNHQIMDETLPGGVLRRLNDAYESAFYPTAEQGWLSYYAARASADCDPGAADGYVQCLLTALDRAKEDVLGARNAHQIKGDYELLMSCIFPVVSDILRYAAAIVGHYDGLETPFQANQTLMSAMEQVNLHDWLVLFDSELAELWSRQGKWESFDEFLSLVRHVERLLWSCGVLPWRAEDGEILLYAMPAVAA